MNALVDTPNFRVVDAERHPGQQLSRGYEPARPDDAAVGAGQARPRSDASRTRQAEGRTETSSCVT
jgi:hypothetical protein